MYEEEPCGTQDPARLPRGGYTSDEGIDEPVTPTDEHLPGFHNPPITEVVVGVSFRDAPALTSAHLGDLWRTKWEERFPAVEEHPPYAPPLEQLDVPAPGPSISLEFSARPMTRLWFLTADGQELVQVQRDWFARNWRKVRPGDQYDRWPNRRTAFERAFREFATYVEDQGLGKISIVQCEVTYVNHIRAGGAWNRHGELSKVLKLLAPVPKALEPEQLQLGGTFIIPRQDGQSAGRLHVTVQPGVLREENLPIFALNLTARGAPEGPGIEGALAFLDRGREHIVQMFAELTTPQMHEEWGRYA
jgi:uncharacterized protein (TIGR04255 family)